MSARAALDNRMTISRREPVMNDTESGDES